MNKRVSSVFDPGLADTGYGVIEDLSGKLKCLDYGSIKTPAKTDTSKRLETIYKKVTEILKRI